MVGTRSWLSRDPCAPSVEDTVVFLFGRLFIVFLGAPCSLGAARLCVVGTPAVLWLGRRETPDLAARRVAPLHLARHRVQRIKVAVARAVAGVRGDVDLRKHGERVSVTRTPLNTLKND